MKDQQKNVAIGVFVLTAIAILIFMVFFLHPYIGDQGKRLRVRFADIDKVNVGTRVLYAGKAVGEVVAIYPLEEVQFRRKERKGDIYVYELELVVDSSVKVYNSDRVSLRTSGLLGEKSVSIDPEPLSPDQELQVVDDQIIYADEIGSVEDAFMEFKSLGVKLDRVLDGVTTALSQLEEEDTWHHIGKTVKNIDQMATSLNKSNFVENIAQVAQNVREGRGTMGALFSRDDLYLRISSAISKLETLFDDLNHYGLLFHLDKGWQRLRARRMNLLQTLRTPQEFRNFFNDEMNQAFTSLARVSSMLDQANQIPCGPCLVDHPEFQKVYGELMRRVSSLEEAVRMYNTQLMEPKILQTELVSQRR